MRAEKAFLVADGEASEMVPLLKRQMLKLLLTCPAQAQSCRTLDATGNVPRCFKRVG